VWESDPDLMAHGRGNRVDIEVDWVASTPPDDLALEALAQVAMRECPGRIVTVRLGTEIPDARWRASRGEAVDVLLDAVCGVRVERPGTAFIHVLYCPSNPWKKDWALNGLCRAVADPFPHWQIFVFKGVLRSRAFLSLTPAKLDRSCLIHEFGHALGLVANPEHRFEDGGGHCTDTRCVMTKPKAQAILDNAAEAIATGEIPWDYCARCRADLETARNAWRSRPR